jgi:methane/ammonia monooxygenase subunit B
MAKNGMRSILSVLICIVAIAPVAFGHGEAGDQPFLKTLTCTYFDVTISPTEISVGEPVTVTGKVRVLETWPSHLEWTGRAFFSPVYPGPVFAMKDRWVNGEETPGSVYVEKGGVYEFKFVILGREPGRYHVHPGVAFQGVGSLLGPGEWVTVKPSAAGFTYPVTLMGGGTIDLPTYHTQFIWWFNFVVFVVGVIWMLWWTLAHRTVTNLAVTAQLPVNDDAPDIGLITPRDHLVMNVLAGITLIFLVGGWVYATNDAPIRLPQQTVWLTPKPLSSGDALAEAKSLSALYDDATRTLEMKVTVKNISMAPITLRSYSTGMAAFVNGGEADMAKAGPKDFVGHLSVEPNGPIAPGETKELTLKITSDIFNTERIIPLRDPQQFTAGLLRFDRTGGGEELVLLNSNVVPTGYTAKYLP